MTSGTRHVLSEAALWLGIFFVALAAFFYLDDRLGGFLEQRAAAQQNASEQSSDDDNNGNSHQATSNDQEESGNGRVVLHAGHSGHFEVKAYINDNSVNLLADTGATYVVLTYEDAETLDLTYNLEFTGRANTANGVSRVAPVILSSIEVGDIRVDNVKAFIAEQGKLRHSLLGMSFIGRLESFAMSGRELVLIQ